MQSDLAALPKRRHELRRTPGSYKRDR
jgi:hypothetical protein